jgi:putative ABC transport system permease protein
MQNAPSPLERWRKEVRAALPAADSDLAEEIAQFVSDRWLDACARGIEELEADRQARRDIDAWRARPEARSRNPRARPWLGWGHDVRLATRAIGLRPAFALAIVVLSAIAVTAVVSAFAVVYGILFRPLPYPHAERLAVIWMNGENPQVSYPDFLELSSASVFEAAAAMSGGRGSLRIGDRIERVNSLSIEPQGLGMLGARPLLGRLLTASDAGRPNAMISHRLWTTHLQANPNIIGATLWVSGSTHTVVGVLEPGFDFELPVPPFFKLEDNDLWTVLNISAASFARRDFAGYEGLVRLAPDRSLAEAQAAMSTTAARLAQAHPATNANRAFRIAGLHGDVVAPVQQPLILTAVAAAITLLVALVNIAILGLVRGLQRQMELTVRHALGAGELKLRRQLITEYGLVAFIGSAVGFVAARYVTALLLASEAAALPLVSAVQFDAPVIVAAVVVMILVALALTAQPLRLLPTVLRTGARAVGNAGRARQMMVGTQIAVALSLATAGALLALSLARLLAVDPGFEPRAAAAARVSIYAAQYPQQADVLAMYDRLLEQLRAAPEVAAAAVSSSLPLSGQTSGTVVRAEGVETSSSGIQAGWQYVSPGYVDATGMRLLAGRDFAADDIRGDSHVTIINESMARALFSDSDPIGRRIGAGGDDQGDWHEIIGVVADVRHTALNLSPTPRVYDLFGQHWGRTLFVVVRSKTDNSLPVLSSLRRTVHALDPETPLFEANTLEALADRSAGSHRLASTIASALALVALLLALIGVHAVVAASVAERTRELGVRAALGASSRDLLHAVGDEFVPTVLSGTIAGICASWALVRLVHAQLFGVSQAEAIWIIPAVTAAMIAAVMIAVIPSARRATRIDPVSAMRL